MPPAKRFEVLREGICSNFMPWAIECSERSEFSAHIESLQTSKGSIASCLINPIDSRRTAHELSQSKSDCVYGNFIVSGNYRVRQFGREETAVTGDIILYDSSSPVDVVAHNTEKYHDISIKIDKSAFDPLISDSLVENVLIKKSELMRPIDSMLKFLSRSLLALPAEELEVLFDAWIQMLPAVLRKSHADRPLFPEFRIGQEITRELFDYIGRELSNPELSPTSAADHLGISVRYVHKLMAISGTTFSTHVMNQRLGKIMCDLYSVPKSSQSIAKIAFRWGFNDLSTFNRLFKRKFGVTPKQFRGGGDAYDAQVDE